MLLTFSMILSIVTILPAINTDAAVTSCYIAIDPSIEHGTINAVNFVETKKYEAGYFVPRMTVIPEEGYKLSEWNVSVK